MLRCPERTRDSLGPETHLAQHDEVIPVFSKWLYIVDGGAKLFFKTRITVLPLITENRCGNNESVAIRE